MVQRLCCPAKSVDHGVVDHPHTTLADEIDGVRRHDAGVGQCSGMTPDERLPEYAARPKIVVCKS